MHDTVCANVCDLIILIVVLINGNHILYKFNVTISCAVFDTYNFLYCITFSSFLLQHPYFLLYVAAL